MALDSNHVLRVSIIGWLVLFVIIVAGATWYTNKTSGHVVNNRQSEEKITAIDEAFQSMLGPKWPYVLLVFTIFIGLLLFFLYLASKKEVISINMSDKGVKTFNTIFVIFTIIFGILMVLLAIKDWMEYKNKEQNGDNPNYVPSINQQKKSMQIISIIGLLLLIVILGWYML